MSELFLRTELLAGFARKAMFEVASGSSACSGKSTPVSSSLIYEQAFGVVGSFRSKTVQKQWDWRIVRTKRYWSITYDEYENRKNALHTRVEAAAQKNTQSGKIL